MSASDVGSRLAAAAGEADSWAQVAAALREELERRDDASLRWLIWAFDYGLDSWRHGTPSAKDPFVPMLGYNDGSSYPPAIEAVEEAALAVWAEAADVDGPVIASRLHDLLWERRWGKRPDLHARAAWAAYVELAAGAWDALHRSVCQVRALQLARSLNDEDLVVKTVRGAVGIVRDCLAAESPMPGAPFHVLGALVDLPRESRPDELDGLLSSAEDLFDHDASLYESVAQMKMAQAGDDEERTRLHAALVERWIQTANLDKGLGRFAHLRHALELADGYGLTDLARGIRQRIQENPADVDDFHEVAVDLRIPRQELDDYVAGLVGDDGWEAALTRLGTMPPPSGDYTANLAQVERQKAEHPLMFLVTKVIYGPHGFPVQVVQDEGLHERVALSEYERLGMELAGLLIGQVLDGIKARYGVPSLEEVTPLFTSAFIPEETAERVAAALLHYWDGRLDECVHVLCPRLEATLRTGFMRAGMTVIGLPAGEKPGGVRTLGELLREALIRDVFRDASRTRYLYNLLCDPYGMNLRNSIAHGFLTKARKEDAALLIQAVCYLRLLDVARKDEAD